MQELVREERALSVINLQPERPSSVICENELLRISLRRQKEAESMVLENERRDETLLRLLNFTESSERLSSPAELLIWLSLVRMGLKEDCERELISGLRLIVEEEDNEYV